MTKTDCERHITSMQQLVDTLWEDKREVREQQGGLTENEQMYSPEGIELADMAACLEEATNSVLEAIGDLEQLLKRIAE